MDINQPVVMAINERAPAQLLWKKSDHADENYVDVPLTDLMVAAVEPKLHVRLPPAYIALMRFQNGGMPIRICHRTSQRTSWAHDHVAITGIRLREALLPMRRDGESILAG